MQERAAEDKQRRSAAAAKEKIMSADVEPSGGAATNNNGSAAATSTEISEHENEVQNDHWPVDCIKCGLSLDTLENFNQGCDAFIYDIHRRILSEGAIPK